jgi:Tol biopolymer transport system component
MDADGGDQRRLTEGPDFEHTWSPNGRQIAFISFRDGTREVYVMDADGTNQTRITNDGNRDLGPVVFSPNGQEIAWMSRRAGNFDIYALGLRSGEERRLTDDPAVDGFPDWTNGNRASH